MYLYIRQIFSIKIYVQHDIRETIIHYQLRRNDKRRLRSLNNFQYKILNKI